MQMNVKRRELKPGHRVGDVGGEFVRRNMSDKCSSRKGALGTVCAHASSQLQLELRGSTRPSPRVSGGSKHAHAGMCGGGTGAIDMHRRGLALWAGELVTTLGERRKYGSCKRAKRTTWAVWVDC